MAARRYAPQIPFPPYAFVPGKHPHPVTDPAGHSFGRVHTTVPALNPDLPWKSLTYLLGLDLFNAGYYWEAHESWEELWVAAGRTGELADFLKGLIKLAAAGVKFREGQTVGVERHSRRALELFQKLRDRHPEPLLQYCGLALDELIDLAQNLVVHPVFDATFTTTAVSIPGFQLTLNMPRDEDR